MRHLLDILNRTKFDIIPFTPSAQYIIPFTLPAQLYLSLTPYFVIQPVLNLRPIFHRHRSVGNFSVRSSYESQTGSFRSANSSHNL